MKTLEGSKLGVKICKDVGGVRAGPGRWDELGPHHPQQKSVKIVKGSELVPGGGKKRKN